MGRSTRRSSTRIWKPPSSVSLIRAIADAARTRSLKRAYPGVGQAPCSSAPQQEAWLHPAELLHRQPGVPDLGHVADLWAVELHHVHVIRLDGLSRRRAGTALAGMRRVEHSVRRHIAALFVRRKRLDLVPTVRHESQQSLHPLRVLLER